MFGTASNHLLPAAGGKMVAHRNHVCRSPQETCLRCSELFATLVLRKFAAKQKLCIALRISVHEVGQYVAYVDGTCLWGSDTTAAEPWYDLFWLILIRYVVAENGSGSFSVAASTFQNYNILWLLDMHVRMAVWRCICCTVIAVTMP